MNTSIYQNIATRTAGDIYIGVVGPVRTGKSTFIKRFMETQIIPNIENVYRKERARDELPQSGSGRTIMNIPPSGLSSRRTAASPRSRGRTIWSRRNGSSGNCRRSGSPSSSC